MATHPRGCDCQAYACRLRAKGVQLDTGAATSVRKGKPDSNSRYNGWERGVVGEERPDGTFMPYLSGEGSPIRNKAVSEGKYDKAQSALKALRTSA